MGLPGLSQHVSGRAFKRLAREILRFELAIALNANGKREEAAQHLLEIVKRDRKWNDDGARKQLVQFFEAWGFSDPAAVEGRKKLSSILFA